MKKIFSFLVLFSICISFLSCGENGQKSNTVERAVESKEKRAIPEFNADSAYYYIERQVAFGPRVPNTKAHKECAEFLSNSLNRFADTVIIQKAVLQAFDGTKLNAQNIIGVFQPEKKKRILLCAHWDSRPFADYDPNPDNFFKPIPGANDGASGVGVLLEIARLVSITKPELGIDIIFFDAEDYGQHEKVDIQKEDTWCLGSQYWSKNPHKPDYYAKYGILLDMVGAENAVFGKEGYSLYFAPTVVRKVWKTAQRIGYSKFFVDQETGYITDDHYYVNSIRNIPCIDIIHYDPQTPHRFFPYWHTLKDNMDAISKETLKAVGQTLITVIIEE